MIDQEGRFNILLTGRDVTTASISIHGISTSRPGSGSQSPFPEEDFTENL
jgi:hypothetical protein